MASPIGSKGTFSIKADEKGSSVPIQISEPAGVSSGNLSLSTWGASFVLANQLHKLVIPRKALAAYSLSHGRRQNLLLELGAGTGLVGLSAAAVWKVNVILTDLAPIIPGLATNIELNESLMARKGSVAECGILDWTNPKMIEFSNPGMSGKSKKSIQLEVSRARVILAADTIYSEEHPELLSNTILTWLAPGPDARVVLCYPLRMAYIDHVRNFWELMEEGGLECFEEGREQADEHWNEVANTPYEWCVWRWKNGHRQGS